MRPYVINGQLTNFCRKTCGESLGIGNYQLQLTPIHMQSTVVKGAL